MLKVYLNDAKNDFLEAVNSELVEFLRFYITIQEDYDEGCFEDAFPASLYRTNKVRCEEVIRELYEYVTDKYIHTLSPLQEYALYHILCFCDESFQLYEIEKEEGSASLFNIIVDVNLLNDEEDSLENGGYTFNNFHHFDFYYQNMFPDWDFLDVDFYFRKFVEDPSYFYESIDINLDDYIELMPSDIKNQYFYLKELHIQKGLNQENDNSIEASDTEIISNEDKFLSHIDYLLNHFKYRIEHTGTYRLLWNDDSTPKKENAVQQLFLDIITSHCKENDIDVSKECNIGRGPVDFKLSYGNQKILIEVKLASNPNLKHGLDKQLIQYMISENVQNALYLVVCFTEKEFVTAESLSKEIEKLKLQYDCSISIHIIDATNKKKSASKLSKEHEFNFINWI